MDLPLADTSSPGDETLYVKFYPGSRINQKKSKEEGRPIYDDTPYVQIMSPGNNRSRIDRPVQEEDKTRFVKQWDAFNSGDEEQLSGTPLEHWPLMSTGQIEEMKYFKVFTVEQLANVSDANAQKFMGLHSLRKKAKEYLARAAEEAPLQRLQSELDVRDKKIEELQEQMTALMADKLDEEDDG